MTRVLPGQAYLENMFGLCGRRALITGSSQGIGLALARGLARAGANVVLNGRDPARLEQARKTLAAEQPDAGIKTLAFDATRHEDVRAAIDEFEAQVGAIDILVNNAGMQYRTPLEDFPAERFEALLQTNVASVFHVGQAAARHMITRGRGKIINIGSVQTALARPGIAPYTATKGAVGNLTKGMATDWAGTGCSATPSHPAISTRRSMPPWSRMRSSPAGSRSAPRQGAGARSTSWSVPASSCPRRGRASSTAMSSMSTVP